MEILSFVRWPEARMAQMVAAMLTRCKTSTPDQGLNNVLLHCSTGGYSGVPR
jgi:hypothetical protein